MEDFEIFQNNFAKIFKDFLLEDLDVKKSEYGTAMYNLMFDEKGSRSVHTNSSPYERFLLSIWQGFIEITNSYQNLNDIPYYINSFPYKSKKLSKVRTFKYDYENYLSEIYILKERLLKYLTDIGRLYKKDERHLTILNSN